MNDNNDGRNDWIKYSNVDERLAHLLRRPAASSKLLFSIFLIAAGVLLFLGNLGVLPIHTIWQFWPLILVMGGLSMLGNARQVQSRIWGIFLILMGGLLLLSSLEIFSIRAHDASWPFSLILIAAGFAALASMADSSARRQSSAPLPETPAQPRFNAGALGDLALFGAVKRRWDNQEFEGGTMTSIFGNIELDLRQATIPIGARYTLINVAVVLGALKLRVPQDWRVNVRGAGILGNFEDKTIPPKTGPDAPVLVVTGFAVLGSVEIED